MVLTAERAASRIVTTEPFLAASWTWAENTITSLRGGLLAHSYLLRPAIYACGLLLFLIFDDRGTQFIYFQF